MGEAVMNGSLKSASVVAALTRAVRDVLGGVR